MKKQKGTSSSKILEEMSLEELQKMSCSAGEIEELTPEEEKERMETIQEMAMQFKSW